MGWWDALGKSARRRTERGKAHERYLSGPERLRRRTEHVGGSEMSAQRRRFLSSGDTFEHAGRRFRVHIHHDETSDPPWEQADGHGPVSECTHRPKCPGERVLSSDGRNERRYYDVAEAMKIARRDGWDTEPFGQGTPGERAARAVAEDFEFLRAWCADEWWYVGVEVEMLGAHDEVVRTESLWNVETWKDYHVEVAYELAEELITQARGEFRAAMREARERRYWINRGVETLASGAQVSGRRA